MNKFTEVYTVCLAVNLFALTFFMPIKASVSDSSLFLTPLSLEGQSPTPLAPYPDEFQYCDFPPYQLSHTVLHCTWELNGSWEDFL